MTEQPGELILTPTAIAKAHYDNAVVLLTTAAQLDDRTQSAQIANVTRQAEVHTKLAYFVAEYPLIVLGIDESIDPRLSQATQQQPTHKAPGGVWGG